MPRYFFNTRIGEELISDPEGEELRNPDRAWEVARAMIRELLRTEGAEGGLLQAILEVTDEEEIVLEFPLPSDSDLPASPSPSTDGAGTGRQPASAAGPPLVPGSLLFVAGIFDNISDCVPTINIGDCREVRRRQHACLREERASAQGGVK